MTNHPIHSKNDDVCCRWLALNAGKLTRKDEAHIERALLALGCRAPILVPMVDMIARVK